MTRPALLLAALAVAVHAPFAGGGFLTDDFLHVERLERQTVAGVFLTPDTFGFYRPLPQLTLLLNLQLSGPDAVLMRLTNVLLHGAVIAAAYAVARLLLDTPRASCLATLAFVLTPKAHPVAVLWISARAELLMSLFSLVAVICWLRWHRGGRQSWLAGAWGCAAAALLCKETAVLLPVLLFFTPPGARYLTRARVLAVAAMLAAAAIVMIGRLQLGALMPLSADPHYDLATPVRRWFRNSRNYFGRSVVSPLALVILSAGARLAGEWGRATLSRRVRPRLLLACYALGWFVIFILPVLPIVSRSELYLYLPVFGLCLWAGGASDALLGARRLRTAPTLLALTLYAVTLGAFQLSRAAALHGDAVFSAKFLDAVRHSDLVARHTGSLAIIPADETTRRYLQDAIGGYIGTAIDGALGRHLPAGFATTDSTPPPDALRLVCSYDGDRVTLLVRRNASP